MSTEGLQLLSASNAALSIALLLVLLLRVPLRRCAGAGVAYASWLLPLLAATASLMPAGPGNARGVLLASAPGAAAAQALQVSGDAVAGWPGLPLLAVWVCGAVASALLFALQQRRFARALGRVLRGRVREGQAGPCVAGLVRPCIVLPAAFRQRYGWRERRLIVAHEIVHLRRGDLYASALVALLRCLFWFNPLLHLACARFRLDQELACDARVLARFPEARRAYAGAMFKAQFCDAGAMDSPGPLGCGWRNPHPLQERIAMLHRPLPTWPRRLGGRLVLAAFGLATAAVTWAAQSGVTTGADFIDAKLTLRSGDVAHTARMINPFGQAFLVTVSSDGQAWQAEFTARPESAGSIRLSARIQRDNETVATPEIVLRDGEAGGVSVDGINGRSGLAIDLQMRRSDGASPKDWPTSAQR
jgi:bla regulator protein blaR1